MSAHGGSFYTFPQEKGEGRMQTRIPKILVFLGAFCLILMLSTLVIGPDASDGQQADMADPASGEGLPGASSQYPIQNTAILPMDLVGSVTEDRGFPLIQQSRGEQLVPLLESTEHWGVLLCIPLGALPCDLRMNTLRIMGAPPAG